MSTLPLAVAQFIEAQHWGDITDSTAVTGGCIHQGQRLVTRAGPTLFLKANRAVPPDLFQREAEGLATLAGVNGGARSPQVYCLGPDFILLEDLVPAPRRPHFWETFGEQLAHQHRITAPQFGWATDNYLGRTPQINPFTADGFVFFGEHRLGFQGNLAQQNGRLSNAERTLLDQLIVRLPNLIPIQPASLLHGDLWSGNLITNQAGQPALIDPAIHYGWAEAELAMTALFGGFPEQFYRAYTATRPLIAGYQERFELYNLYHLLNHLNLFGSGYLEAVRAVLRRYA